MALRTLSLAALLAAAPLSLAAETWTLDKAHTQVTFSVDHLGFSMTNGIFREFDATIDYDPENVEASSVEFVIDAASIDTFFAQRDDHIRSADFLDVENHPEITFVSTGVTQIDEDSAELTGDLTIRGETQPVTFQAELRKVAPSPFDPNVQIAGFQLTGEIDRTEFGVDAFAPAVGTVIPVTIDLEINAPSSGS